MTGIRILFEQPLLALALLQEATVGGIAVCLFIVPLYLIERVRPTWGTMRLVFLWGTVAALALGIFEAIA